MRRMLQSYLGKAKTRLSAAAALAPILTPSSHTTIHTEPSLLSAPSSPRMGPMQAPTAAAPSTTAETPGSVGHSSTAASAAPSTMRQSQSPVPLAVPTKAEAGGSLAETTFNMASHIAKSVFNLLLPNGVGVRDAVVMILALALMINMMRLGRTSRQLAEVGGRLEVVMREQEDMVRLVKELQERLVQTAAECVGPALVD